MEKSMIRKTLIIVVALVLAVALAITLFFIIRDKLYPEYIITFDANGGVIESAQMSVRYNRAYSLPTPKKEGYSFSCWTYNGEYVALAGIWSIHGEAELVANWEIRDEAGVVYTPVEGGLEVTAVRGKTYKEINVPKEYNGLKVLGIRNGAFDNYKSQIESPSMIHFPIYVPTGVSVDENVLFNDKMVVKYYDAMYSTDEFEYLEYNNEIEVIDYNGNYNTDVIIPQKYQEMPVTKIGEYLFYGAQHEIDQTSYTFFRVFIPDTITHIRKNAFAECLGVKCSLYYYNDKGEFREMIDLPTIVKWVNSAVIDESNVHLADVISMLRSAIGWTIYTAARINVTFDTSGGELSVLNQQLRYNGEYSLPTPTKEGCVFEGWYLEDTLIAQTGEEWNISRHVTLTAHWSEAE